MKKRHAVRASPLSPMTAERCGLAENFLSAMHLFAFVFCRRRVRSSVDLSRLPEYIRGAAASVEEDGACKCGSWGRGNGI